MSRLDPSVIALDKGLNLQTAKILAPAGSALDSLNYEQVDFQGQKRIDGFTRYDGGESAALDEIYVLKLGSNLTVSNIGQVFLSSDNTYVGIALDKYSMPSDLRQYYLKSDQELIALHAINLVKSLGAIPLKEVIGNIEYNYPSDKSDLHKECLLAASSYLRSRNTELPGTVSGLHWFRDKLHAVADLNVVKVTARIEQSLTSLTGSIVRQDSSEQVILGVKDLGNNECLFLLGQPLRSGSFDIYSQSNSELIGDGEAIDLDPEFPSGFYKASLFKANNEEHEYFKGWQFIHQGWEVAFENGYVPYGGLTSVNQNRKGLGIEGPTSIAGDSGRPLFLLQKVNIANLAAQANGWKTSNTPTSYNLDPLAFSVNDDTYIYADFYVEWNSEENKITTPDVSTTVLTERSATSDVEVDILWL